MDHIRRASAKQIGGCLGVLLGVEVRQCVDPEVVGGNAAVDVRPSRPLALSTCSGGSEGTEGGPGIGRNDVAVVGDVAVVPVASTAVDEGSNTVSLI